MAEDKQEIRPGPAMPVAEVAPVAPVPYWSYLVPLGTALIAMVQVVALAIIGYLMAGVKTDSAATAETVEKVHVAVNSERTAMVEKIEMLRLEILELSKDKARSQQKALDAAKK